MLDLRGAEPKYVFARVNYFGDETRGGRTFPGRTVSSGSHGTTMRGGMDVCGP